MTDTPKFKLMFPDFPADDFPALPAGFHDTSWRQDMCPSMTNHETDLHIMVDYPADATREFPGGKRFMVARESSSESLLETDDWQEVLKLIEGIGAAT